MKKILLTLCLSFGALSAFAVDCSNPNSRYTVLFGVLGTYTCGTYEQPGTLCYGQGQGTITGVTGCTHLTGAPINSGVALLIVAGIGIGSYVTVKKSKAKAVLTA